MRTDSYEEWQAKFAVLLADDWFIWVEDRLTHLVYRYCTEIWAEWPCDCGEKDCKKCGDVEDGPAVTRMIPFCWLHSPDPETDDKGRHMTTERFLVADYAG